MRTKKATGIEGGSPERFGYEWSVYDAIEPIYEEQFKRWTVLIPEKEWKGKAFLDVGCGMGRNSYWPAPYGAKRGVAIDIDARSVEAARQTLKDVPQVEVKYMSAYDIDASDEFDIVFSIGVIHHLEFPETALKKMVQAAKPKGKVLILVYGYENSRWVVHFFNPFRKLIFSRLPIQLTHFLSLLPTALLWIFLRLGLGKIEYLRLLRNFSFKHLRSIVFDQMLPTIAHYWKREEVEKLLKQAGLENIKLQHVNDMSWTALGTKPA